MDQTRAEGRAHRAGWHGLCGQILTSITGVSIRVRILGAAAGGGLPQWNCACRNCQAARRGQIEPQTQSSVAISSDGRRWFLINASPDLRAQIEAFPALQPSPDSPRNSPIEAVLLTNADLDHTLGLLLLREGKPVQIHAAREVRECLTNDLAFTAILSAFCGVTWHELPFSDWKMLPCADGHPSGLRYRALPLPSPAPIFHPAGKSSFPQSVAFLFQDQASGLTLLLAPDVFEITPGLETALHSADAVLFDGSFWSNDELGGVKNAARQASAMGHLPIKNGSLPFLAKSPARHRVYIHINNTNPILLPGTDERREVEEASIVVGHDHFEFEI